MIVSACGCAFGPEMKRYQIEADFVERREKKRIISKLLGEAAPACLGFNPRIFDTIRAMCWLQAFSPVLQSPLDHR